MGNIKYNPVFDSDIWKNTAGRLILYSFSGGVFSFYNIVFFYENQNCVIRNFQFRKCLPVNSNKTIKKKSHRYMSCGILCLCEFIIVLGQLNAYVGYYKKNEMIEGDNPPVGILLCTDKGSQMVEYALSGMDNQLFVSTYMLHLPDKKKLEEFMLKEIEEMEM